MLMTPMTPPNWRLEATRRATACGKPVLLTRVGSHWFSRLSTVVLRKMMNQSNSVMAMRPSVKS